MPVPPETGRRGLVEVLARAGFVAAEEEADDLLLASAGHGAVLDQLLARRLTGEPLEWIVGRMSFGDVEIHIDPGVYVPRRQSEALAARAAARLPAGGTAIDVCTGAGAVAKVLATTRPGARVVASDLSADAVSCARANGVEAYEGDLFTPLPDGLEGTVDVVVGVVPYVPTPALPLLHRDALTFESPLSYDGGPDGTVLLRRVLAGSPRFLRAGGVVLLELGGDQADHLRDEVQRLGYGDLTVLLDTEGDVRGIEATYGAGPAT